MDIHKPKPWHGLREFLKEYLIIVIGVLTALGAEQAVEWAHWRHTAQDARASMIRGEKMLIEFSGEREAQSGCLAAEFRSMRAVLDQASATGALPAVASVRNPNRRSWTFRAYDQVVSGQILPHLPVRESQLVTSINAWSEYLQKNRDVEIQDWSVLRSLEGAPRRTGEAELASLRAALSGAIYQAGVMRGGAHNMSEQIIAHGILSPKEIEAHWEKGFAEGEKGAYGACAPRPGSDTEQLLQQLEMPVRQPSWDQPANWPKGAN
jgi:hypothetical protein